MDFNAVIEDQTPLGVHYPGMPVGMTTLSDPFNLELVKQSFAPYAAKLAEVKAQADGLRVTNDPTAQDATAITGDVKRLAKSIDQRRKELIEEPSGYVKAVNSMAKMFTEPAGEIETLLKRKLSNYQAQRELERWKEEERIRKAQQELYKKQQAEAKAAHVEAPPPPAPIPIKTETITRSDTGASAHVRKAWKAEVTDPIQVPREFCEPSMKLINEAVKGGIREIAGVRIWEDIQTILRT